MNDWILRSWKNFLLCKDFALQDALPLFHNEFIVVPFRFLTDQEVLQISGLCQVFRSIKKHRTIRNFAGNSFHPELISLALGSSWLNGQVPSTINVPPPSQVSPGDARVDRRTLQNSAVLAWMLREWRSSLTLGLCAGLGALGSHAWPLALIRRNGVDCACLICAGFC